MLKSLYISSFVIIDEMQVDFHEGMSVLTGETGAGKSIIIDAIGQLCGNRSSAQLVRHGKEKAIIEGVFEIDENQEAVKAFEEIGIDFDNDIIIHKEIHANGKSTIKVNYRPVTNAALKIIAPYLIHIHSQFETQTIFSIKNHITILDRFIDDDTYRNDYLDYYRHYRDLVKKIRDINEVDMSDERIEYYQSQYEELKDLEYTDEDIENLEHEAEMMKNYEKLNTHMRTFDSSRTVTECD
ncbi:AAA family ATPase [Sharpea azabuensis]|uniref:AAA family ATPase n=1 Tax=Sharpea azabuensis TaxID=322505 RepID=UPI0023F3F279|nr:AAA family ATPase [Sharpea azabuensis]